MPYDVRQIANFILEIAERENLRVTNFSLNKIIYFLHGWYLARYEESLVSAKIEAWEFGPVFREIYHQFKDFGNEAITRKAKAVDLSTGETVECRCELGEDESEFLEELSKKYLQMTFSTLFELSHECGGPWDQVWNHSSSSNPGMEISGDLIRDHFAAQMRH